MANCREQHPADESRACIKEAGGHQHHSDAQGVWPNEAYVPPRPKATKKTKNLLSKFLEQGQTDPSTRARADDPVTSKMAARGLGDLRPAQREVHTIFRDHGEMIDEVLLERAREDGSLQTPSGLRSRRDELTKMGLLVDTGRKGKTSNDRDSIIWALPGSDLS